MGLDVVGARSAYAQLLDFLIGQNRRPASGGDQMNDSAGLQDGNALVGGNMNKDIAGKERSIGALDTIRPARQPAIGGKQKLQILHAQLLGNQALMTRASVGGQPAPTI